jgi:hypothetical protein
MKHFLCCLVFLMLAALFLTAQSGGTKQITLADLRDKIEGAWAGQMIGVSFGAPTEFRSRGKIIEGDLPPWKPDRISNSINQDDLYVDMTFSKVLEEKGLDATVADFGAMFREAKYSLWHANLAARRALKRGVPAELSGTPKYNAHANDIDFQIEADFAGVICPGLFQSSNAICERAGKVMNYGDGIYGGMFVSGMYAAAFFESNPRRVVEIGLACIPAKSPYALLIKDVLDWSKKDPGDWKRVWKLIGEKWDTRDPCPNGALDPYNIDAKLNGAYIALGLLYGESDFAKTVDISTRAGQDSDCNPASACGVLGTMVGYKRIPEIWKSGIPEIADKQFRYTAYTFRSIVEASQKMAIENVKRNGGSLDGERLTVRMQKPMAPKLAVWDDYGSPTERVAADSNRWNWKGTWREEKGTRVASEKGAEASIEFSGTGVILVGPYLPDGGKADVYLDGKLDRTVDVYPDEDRPKGHEAVWHAFKLAPGKHMVRLVVRGEPYGESTGPKIGIDGLVTFQ